MTQLPITTQTDEPCTGYVLDIFNPRNQLCGSLAPKVALLKAVLGINEQGQLTRSPPPQPFFQDLFTYIMCGETWARRTRKPRGPRKPTLVSVSKNARKAGIDPARIEIKPDGSYVVDIGKSEPAASGNPWPLDEFRTKETLAHSLSETRREKKTGPVPPMKYGDERKTLLASLPIVEALHCWVSGKSFSFANSQEIDRNNARDERERPNSHARRTGNEIRPSLGRSPRPQPLPLPAARVSRRRAAVQWRSVQH
jgi:hypothetical protein